MTTVKQLDDQASSMSLSYASGKNKFSTSIQSVTPTDDCKEIKPNRFSCPLLIDYQDQLMSAIGTAATSGLKSNFVFVKEGSNWTIDENFDKTLVKTIVNARLDILYGKQLPDESDTSSPIDTPSQSQASSQ